MLIKALIFDFDGLILDTETPEYQAINEVYAEFGQKLSIATFGQVVGSQYTPEFEPREYLQKLTGKPVETDFFWDRVNRRRQELLDQKTILPGVKSLLQEGKARGIKLAVASSSPHTWVDPFLKRLKISQYFDAVICKDDVRHVKPAPDLFLSALARLSVRADEAVIFEDSLNGVLAARQAGIRVVAVPNPITEELNIKGENLRLRSLADISLDQLGRIL